jgi:hypothetical protein
VEALVNKEMQAMARTEAKDYLKDFPLPSTPKIDSHEIRSEIARVTQQQQTQPLSDRYIQIEAPISSDPQVWHTALERAKINFAMAE